MDSANWLTAIDQSGRNFVYSLPDALWLAYAWARDWQILLGSVFLLIAALIFAQASVRSARIRAAASVRAAQIAAGLVSNSATASRAQSEPTFRPSSTVSHAHDLANKLEQLRSLIRSAMTLLASDVDGADAIENVYYQRIIRLRFEENDLPSNATSNTLELYKRLLLQLASVRQFSKKKRSTKELSEALVQLNARARELAAADAPRISGSSNEVARLSDRVRS
jgi:hypothetical protein